MIVEPLIQVYIDGDYTIRRYRHKYSPLLQSHTAVFSLWIKGHVHIIFSQTLVQTYVQRYAALFRFYGLFNLL